MMFFVSIDNIVAVEAENEEEAKAEATVLLREWLDKGEVDWTVESE